MKEQKAIEVSTAHVTRMDYARLKAIAGRSHLTRPIRALLFPDPKPIPFFVFSSQYDEEDNGLVVTVTDVESLTMKRTCDAFKAIGLSSHFANLYEKARSLGARYLVIDNDLDVSDELPVVWDDDFVSDERDNLNETY